MKEDTISQILSFGTVVLIPFIPNSVMRYVALVFTSLFSFAYLVFHNSPTCQVARLYVSIKGIDALFNVAANECTRDPRFISETALKLTELKYAVSRLRTTTINTKHIAWKKYPRHIVRLASSINKCQWEMDDLRVHITLGLEFARQQGFEEDIKHKTATLFSNFLTEDAGEFLRMRASGTVGQLYLGPIQNSDRGYLQHLTQMSS